MMSPFKPSLEEYNRHISEKQKEVLLESAKQAVAWGEPSSISSGMSHSHLIYLIAKLAEYIERNT